MDDKGDQDNLPKLIGRYEIKRLLGAGAMGRVYLAEDPRIKRRLAIKVVRVDAARQESDRSEFLARFQREAEVSGLLNDPGIVTIYDVGDSDLGPYLAMEFVEGQPLDGLLKSGEHATLPLSRKLQIASVLASALDHAHSKGIVHRDVKPGNVMISGDGRAKLMDFGIAKREDASLTQTGTFLGTPSYASPEQIKEGHATALSDVFSFGVLVFELLSGSLPFPGNSINTILYRIVNEPPAEVKPPVTGLLPERWDTIFLKVLAKAPEARYPTCSAFLRDLVEAATDLTPAERQELLGPLKGGTAAPLLFRVPDEPPVESLSLPRKSGRGWILGSLAVGLLGVGGWLFWRGDGGSLVQIETEPGRARVEKDGRDLGRTPLPVRLKRGERLQVSLKGFEPLVYTHGGGVDVPRLTLNPLRTDETLRTLPEGAKVVLDGEEIGVTPVQVKGWNQGQKHDVTFTHASDGKVLNVRFQEGEAPGSQAYTLLDSRQAEKTGEVRTVDAQAPGSVSFTGVFPVRVKIAGKSYGEVGSGRKIDLPPGTHRLELSNPGVFYSEIRTLTLQPGQGVSLTLPGIAHLTVETFPSSGVVLIDGASTGVESDGGTPIRVAKGPHKVSIQGKSGGIQSVDLTGDRTLKYGGVK